MQREIIKWLQTLDLSSTLKNPRRDMADGYAAAKIVLHYAGHEKVLAPHAISTGSSVEERRHNWNLVLSALNKLGCTTVTKPLVESVIERQRNAAYMVLDFLYEFFTKQKLQARSVDPVGQDSAFLKEKEVADTGMLLTVTQEVPPPTGETLLSTQNVHGDKTTSARITPSEVQAGMSYTRSAEIATGAKGIRKLPRYARYTESTLVRHARRGKEVSLAKEKYLPDEKTSQVQHEKIQSQHRILKNIYRDAESTTPTNAPLTTILRGPHTSALLKQRREENQKRRLGQKSRSSGPILTNDRILSPELDGDSVKRITVKIGGDALNEALKARESMQPNEHKLGHEAEEIFASFQYRLQPALSHLLLEALTTDQYILEDLLAMTDDGHREDELRQNTLAWLVAHRDVLPLDVLRLCWGTLDRHMVSIAVSLLHAEEGYQYLLRTFSFAFGLDSAQVALLHVSTDVLPADDDGDAATEDEDETEPSPSAAVRRAQNRNHHRSQSVTEALLQASHTEATKTKGGTAATATTSSGKRDRHHQKQKAIHVNHQAFHLASVFVFLSRLHQELSRLRPLSSVDLLAAYFLPDAFDFLVPFGSAAIMEAVARVVVSSFAWQPSLSLLTETASELTGFLLEVLRPWIIENEQTDTRKMTPFRFDLLLYHCVSEAQETMKAAWDDAAGVSNNNTDNDSISGRLSRPDFVPLPEPLVEASYTAAVRCANETAPSSRVLGIAFLVQLLSADCWQEVLDLLPTLVVEPLLADGRGAGAAASQWEYNAVTLETLTLAFRKIVILHAQEQLARSEGQAAAATAPPPPPSAEENVADGGRPSLSQRILTRLPLPLLDKATERCLSLFLSSPSLQRQLALSIVGNRLLPDHQPRTAKMWVQVLLRAPAALFRSCLTPIETEPLPLQEAPSVDASPFRDTAASAVGADTGLAMTPPAVGHSNAAATNSSLSVPFLASEVWESYFAAAAATTATSSIHVLSGKVESTYVVAPLNQSWDTCGVVQAVLGRQDRLTPFQLLSVVAAALLSPQDAEVQQARLLHDLHVAGAEARESSTAESEVKELEEGEGEKSNDDDDEDEDNVGALRLTLRDLALHHLPAADDERTTESEASFWQQMDHANAASLADTFWVSTLKRIYPTISHCIAAAPSTPSKGGGGGNGLAVDLSEMDEAAIEIRDTRQLAVAVLFTLFRRHAPAEMQQHGFSSGRELLKEAVRWAEGLQ